MEVQAPTYRQGAAGLAWLLGYVLTMGLVVWGVFHSRAWALTNLSTSEARADWESWRHDAAEQSKSGPVRRSQSQSAEPPTLVLLRDYFGVLLSAAIVFSSLLFATAMIAVRGALGRGRKPARILNRQPWNS